MKTFVSGLALAALVGASTLPTAADAATRHHPHHAARHHVQHAADKPHAPAKHGHHAARHHHATRHHAPKPDAGH